MNENKNGDSRLAVLKEIYDSLTDEQKEKAKAKKCASELPIAFRNYCLASEDVSREVT